MKKCNNTQKMSTIQQLEEQINELTKQLKEMIGNESNYKEIWDRRVDLKRELDKLLDKLKK